MIESSPDPPEPELRRPAQGLEETERGRTPGMEGGRRAKSYTEKPQIGAAEESSDHRGRKRRSPWIFIAVLAAALAISGLVWQHNTSRTGTHPWSATQTTQSLTLTEADVDQAATDAARAALSRGEVPATLANADAETLRKVLGGQEKLYTKRLLDENQQRGAVVHVQVSTGGVFLGEDILTTERPHGTTFPAGAGAPTQFHFTVEQAGPKGVVSCYVNSANGGIVSTPPLAAGQSGDLEVVAR